MVCAAVLACAAGAWGRETQPFERYQVIIDRAPFGAAPVNASATGGPAAAPAAPPAFVQTLKLHTITATDDGLRVGFTDTKANKNYFLLVGDSEDGYEVLDADYSADKAFIRKDGEEQWLSMGAGGGAAAPAAADAASQMSAFAKAMAARKARASLYGARRDQKETPAVPPAATVPGPVTTPPPEAPKYTPEEMQRHLEQYQMDVIRQGLPALPIPLTPEMDAQLVNEGVLPPAEEAEPPPAPQ